MKDKLDFTFEDFYIFLIWYFGLCAILSGKLVDIDVKKYFDLFTENIDITVVMGFYLLFGLFLIYLFFKFIIYLIFKLVCFIKKKRGK